MTTSTASARRHPWALWLIAAGTLATIAGAFWSAVAKSLADQSGPGAGAPITLPVHTYAQYTQRGLLPDYSGLWAGLIVAGIGAIVLLAGALVAFIRSR